ncbi:MAG: HPF/RaiA family ribosome-associated protein [Nitrospiraceae bacterium]|nr:HPF/RaiA family ribosome-associated protein [Nitrospiraceae bacterium]
MEIPLQITAKDMELTDAIKADITEKAEKLDSYYDRIMRCRVAVECPKRHPHEGKLYDVHIYITVPGGEVTVKHAPNEDLYVSIRDAFQAARRRLEDFAREQRNDVKTHEEQPQGVIGKLFTDKGYGFLERPDGVEVYFHANSVVNRNFDDLKVGMKVRFAQEDGVKGPQASTVKVK